LEPAVLKDCNHFKFAKQKFKFSIFNSIDLVNYNHWNSLVREKNIYLSIPYLKALEFSLAETVDFRYILFYDSELSPVGVAVVQLHRFKSGEMDFAKITSLIGDVIPFDVLDKMNIRVMLCGNAYSTGENGFLFCDGITVQSVNKNVARALSSILKIEKRSNDNVSFILLKDFWPGSFENIKDFQSNKFQDIRIDVNMVLKMRPDWLSWDDYLSDLTTKFRTKAKGVYKKSTEISSKDLSASQISKYSNQIDELHMEVIHRAKFGMGKLNSQTFEAIKRNLPDHFNLTGYFLDEKMIGFSSFMRYNHILEANFVGIKYDINAKYAIYQRMLCDFIKVTIRMNCIELRLGRTAEEIKSSFGAEPVQMKLLIKHRNSVTNKLIKPFVKSIEPTRFKFKKPFKVEVYDEWIH
jgi:hypothetical protein